MIYRNIRTISVVANATRWIREKAREKMRDFCHEDLSPDKKTQVEERGQQVEKLCPLRQFFRFVRNSSGQSFGTIRFRIAGCRVSRLKF